MAQPESTETDRPTGRPVWLFPLLGVVFVVLVLVSSILTGSSPSSSTSGLKVIKHYRDHQNEARAAGLLTVMSIPVGLFFFAFLREFLHRSRASRPYATIALVGAAVFAAGGCVSAGMTWALADVPTKLTPNAAQALNILNKDLSVGLLLGGISTMQLGFGVAILCSRLLPVWLGWLTIVIGVVALAGPIGFFAFVATGVWVLIVSGVMWSCRHDCSSTA